MCLILTVGEQAALPRESCAEDPVIAVVVTISQKSKIRLQGTRQQPKVA